MVDTSTIAKLDFLSKITNVQWGGIYAYIEANAAAVAGLPVPFTARAQTATGGTPLASSTQVTQQSGGAPEFTARFIFKPGFSSKPSFKVTLGGENVLTGGGGRFLTFNNLNFYLISITGHKVAQISNLSIDPPFNPENSFQFEGELYNFSTSARPLNQTYTFTVNKIGYLKSDRADALHLIPAIWPNVKYIIDYASLTSNGVDVRAPSFTAWNPPLFGQPPRTV